MSRDKTQRQVRQRDRFQCKFQDCADRGQQYAHIVAEDDGGPYDLDNLVFLCYDHHSNWQESAQTTDAMKQRLQEFSKNLRDLPPSDSVISQLFGWLTNDDLTVSLGGGLLFRSQERILESNDPSRPYLALRKDDLGILRIDANFEDGAGVTCLEVKSNRMTVHTADAWDIVIKRRHLRFTHADRQMWLQIKQGDNFVLEVTGELYLNGGRFSITPNHILDHQYNNKLVGSHALSNGRGLYLAPGEMGIG